jgi:riboflavin biosynthesis pyrimidine reductase
MMPLVAFHIVLCFYLSHACLGSTTASYASTDGLAPTRSIDDKIIDVPDVEEGSNDITDATKIKHILDRVLSWMKEKRRNDSKRNNRQEYNVNHDTARWQYHRPFVTLAYAQSLDGMIATQTTSHGDKDDDDEGTMHKSTNLQLSCPTSMELTHNLRNMHDAILVGWTTFLLDQPRLNARLLASSSSISSSTTTKLSPNNENVQQQQPMPVVLDTNLHNLQYLLFNRTICNTDIDSSVHQPSKDGKMTTLLLPDGIILSRIKAKNPTICCSSQAAKSFLNILEFIVQDQEEYNKSNKKRRREKTYSITVYKTMEEEYDTPHQEVADVHASEKSANIISSNNNNNNYYLPIKITIRIETHHHNHHRNSKIVNNDDVDLSNELTFTLLPCQTITKITQYADYNDNYEDGNCDKVDDTMKTKTKKKKNSQTLNVRHVLHQLYTQFDIESIMVEGGAAILSSFVNECCMRGGGDSNDTTWSKDTVVVDCICVTIAPTIIGGKWGLPVLGGLSVTGRNSNFDSKLIAIKNGEFVTLGQDCTFLGKIRLKEGIESVSSD